MMPDLQIYCVPHHITKTLSSLLQTLLSAISGFAETVANSEFKHLGHEATM